MLIDRRVEAVQLANIQRLEQSGTISNHDADEARARAGQVMVLRGTSGAGEVLVYAYGLGGQAAWTHLITYPGAPAGMAASLDVELYMRAAVHEHYDVDEDERGRVVARPREEP